MNRILFLFIPAFFPIFLAAQCPVMSLGALQSLENADPSMKESKILELGFDLQAEFTRGGQAIKQYSKCWSNTVSSVVRYEQLLYWNTDANTITFLTSNKAHQKALRDAVTAKHPGAGDVAYGQHFVYRFGSEQVLGVVYGALTLELR